LADRNEKMAEITINTIIKIILILLVIVLVILSFFMLWKNFIKPYFEGFGNEVIGSTCFMAERFKRKF
jgi:hypothetical protein